MKDLEIIKVDNEKSYFYKGELICKKHYGKGLENDHIVYREEYFEEGKLLNKRKEFEKVHEIIKLISKL